MKPRPQETVPEYKKKTVVELTNLIKNSKTILLASIKNLPASQFQEIGKRLRGKAVIKVPKKNLILRAIENSKNEELKKIEPHLDNSVALLFSDLDSYELSAELLKNKSPAKAKPGQIAPIDIEIPAGPTDLPPGPAISELGSVGLQVQIENGKIKIREPRVIVTAGKIISQNVADVMSKLDIKPFSIGYIPLAGYDLKGNKLYLNINIDYEGTKKDLIEAFGRALPFAVNIGYYSSETIPLMLQKGAIYEKVLLKRITGESDESSAEQKISDTEISAEENKLEAKKANSDFAASFF